MRKSSIALLFLTSLFAVVSGESKAERSMITGDFWKPSSVIWGDGRPLSGPPSPKHIPHGFKSTWKINVPETGWYELFLVGGGSDFGHDVFLDGEEVYQHGTTDKNEKAGNLWLNKGNHDLRIQRVGRNSFPIRAFKTFELRRSDDSAANSISASKTLVDVMRAGESFVIKVTGGGTGQASNYELLSQNLMAPSDKPEVVATVSFEASDKPVTKTINIKCPREGAYNLSARIKDGKELTCSEFPIGPYAVVDTKGKLPSATPPEPVFDIDCVKQTLNGKSIPASDFIECNGPSRVTTSVAGTYRESHDCTPPEAPLPSSGGAGAANSFSGFSYKLPKLPKIQVPYLLEIEYPDDDQRCIVMGVHYLDPKTGTISKLSGGYNCKSVQTGGLFPLSNKMRTHRAIFWPKTANAILTIFSQEIGTRAAAARIKLSYFPNGNLPLPQLTKNGRNFMQWYEEAHNWQNLVGVQKIYRHPLVADLVGLNRWAQFVRYHGGNAISALGVGYQQAFWRQHTLEGLHPVAFDAARLCALVCEKYGLKYMPEIFCNQWYLNKVVLPGKADHPADVRSVNCNGAETGPGSASCDLNPLHPLVQKLWINALGELSDKLRDCDSFLGIALRCDQWQFRGDFIFPGLAWGYGDWIIKQYEKETGIKVPGELDDPDRFMKRYEFLTNSQNRKKWIDWRCDKLLTYHKKVRDRIRGNRDDLKLVFWGNFNCDPVYKVPENVLSRMKESGLDLAKIRNAGNIGVMPAARYGSRFTTSQTQAVYDDFFKPDYAEAGMGDPRAFASYMTYLELAREWPAEKLGLPLPKDQTNPPYHCSASLGAGRNSLEKYAAVVANQDSSLLMEGGNVDSFGDPEIWREWFAEYNALPKLPFSLWSKESDPVAVWSAHVSGVEGFKDGTYFYAINRARWSVKTNISVSDTTITRLTNDETVKVNGETLSLDLKPFEIRSFKMPLSARITNVATIIPQAMSDYIHNRIAFAQKLRENLKPGAIAKGESQSYDHSLAVAWKALENQKYWRARSVLRSAPMMRVYELTATMPSGQIVGKFPNLMREAINMGHWNLLEHMIQGDELIALANNQATVVDSNTFNPEWGGYKVLKSKAGKLELTIDIPASGDNTLQFGLVSSDPTPIIVKTPQQLLPLPAIIREGGKPDMTAFSNVSLLKGKQKLTLTRPDGKDFGLYGLKILPNMRPMGTQLWSVCGPFKSLWAQAGCKYGTTAEGIKVGMEKAYPPERDTNINSVYKTEDGKEHRWQRPLGNVAGCFSDRGVNMAARTASPSRDFNFALAYIYSDKDQEALLKVPCDWWARAYLNGERVRTDLSQADVEKTGADFTTWYPRYTGVMKLKKGENKLLIKQQGGSLGSGFAAYISDLPGLKISPEPKTD